MKTQRHESRDGSRTVERSSHGLAYYGIDAFRLENPRNADAWVPSRVRVSHVRVPT